MTINLLIKINIMSASNIFKRLGKGIADFSELNVQSFSGDLKSAVVTTKGQGSVIDWAKLMDKATTTGEVNLIASTQIKFDGDSNTFYETNATETMRIAHTDAVESAQKYRRGLLKLFKKELDTIVSPK